MNRSLRFVAALVWLAAAGPGCSGSGANIQDGGLVGQDGWPVRGLGEQRRCPDGTDLIDEQLPGGRRTITCKSTSSPLAKGFLITWYPDDSLATESELDPEGRPIWRKTWHPNGTLETEEIYADNSVQRRTSFFSDGSEREIMERTPTGSLLQRFRAGGGIEASGEYLGEDRAGTWKEWVNGALETTEYVDGKKQGTAKRVYPDQSIESGSYNKGVRDLTWERVGKNGIPVLQETYQNGKLNGPRTAYFPTGQPREVSSYRQGQLHGDYRRYFPLGELESKGAYRCGQEDGEWTHFYKGGSLKSKGQMVAGRESAEWTHYFVTGEIERVQSHAVLETPKCESN